MPALTVAQIDEGIAGLIRIRDDVYRTVEERRLARKRIDDELDRRNEVGERRAP